MTTALERLSTVLATAPPVDEPAVLFEGLVIQATPVIRVDAGAMKLQCKSLVDVEVGQTVQVLRTGSTALILGVARALPLGLQFLHRGLGLTPTATTGGVTTVDTTVCSYVPKVDGWVEFAVSVWVGNDTTSVTYSHMLYSNAAAGPGGAAYQTPSVSAAASGGAGLYAMLPQQRLVYPAFAGVDIAPTWRLGQSATGLNYRSGISTVKVWAS